MDSYHSFSRKLILTTACTVLLSSAIGDLIKNSVGYFTLPLPGWLFSLVQIALACFGLWWVNRNGVKRRIKK